MKRLIAASLAILSLTACGSVPVKPALDLAASGKTLTKAASASLSEVSKDISAVAERQQVRSTLERCSAAIQAAAAKKPPVTPVCEPAQLPPDDLIEANRKLAALMYGRAEMFDALNGAYGALEAEANYKAGADMEGAITELGGTATQLAGLAQTAGLPPLPGLDLIVPMVAHVGGLAAERAQRERLIQASRAIRGAALATQAAVQGEARLYGAISVRIDDNRARVTDALIVAGFVDPKPAMQAFMSDMGVTLAPDLKVDNARLISMSRAVNLYRSHAAAKARAQSYLKLDAALGQLIKAHVKFEQDAASPSPDLDGAIAELKYWTDALGKLQAAAQPKDTP